MKPPPVQVGTVKIIRLFDEIEFGFPTVPRFPLAHMPAPKRIEPKRPCSQTADPK